MTSRLIAAGMVMCIIAGAAAQSRESESVDSALTQQLMALNADIDAAVVRGDVAFLDHALAADFRFPHGDEWTSGGEPTLVDSKASWLASVKARRTPFIAREVGAQRVELHEDVALVTGKIHVRSESPVAKWRDYTVWFLRTYAKRQNRWQLISHRTVHETFAAQ